VRCLRRKFEEAEVTNRAEGGSHYNDSGLDPRDLHPISRECVRRDRKGACEPANWAEAQ
jgi:hypothetical protein